MNTQGDVVLLSTQLCLTSSFYFLSFLSSFDLIIVLAKASE